MPANPRKRAVLILVVGLGIFGVVNGIAWTPGIGGRNDKQPGMEIERYFGWPACYLAELWRSQEHVPLRLQWATPLSSPHVQMFFVYRTVGVLALVIDVVVALASIGLVIIIDRCQFRRPSTMLIICGMLLVVLIAGLVSFGERAGVYL